MTNLTEQWEKGELKAGWYYVKNEFGNIFISEYSEDYDYIGDKVVKDFFTEVSEITKVIAPVPSYEEWQQLHKFLEEFNALDVAKENQQLKELLSECNEFLYEILTGTHSKLSFKLESGIRKKYYMMSLSELKTKIDNAIGEKK